VLKLLKLQIKETLRSTFWQKSLFLNILLSVIGFYLLLNIALIGCMAESIIANVFPGTEVVVKFTELLFYYFLFDLLIRFLLVPVPAVSVQPFLTLPIRRRVLFHYPLIKSLLAFYNLIFLLLIIPFFAKVIIPMSTTSFSITWFLCFLCLSLVNIFLAFSFKKYFLKQPALIFLFIAIVGISLYSDVKGYYHLSGLFIFSISRIVSNPFFLLIPVGLVILTYFLGYTILKRGYYLEEKQAKRTYDVSGFNFLKRFGESGNLIRTEIRLILRNQRPRSMMMFAMFLFVYAWFIYSHGQKIPLPVLIFAGFLLTAPFSITYGQYIFGWEGRFFDFYLTKNISENNFIRAKFLLLALTGIASFLLTLPFAFFNHMIALINLIMLIFNIGVTSIILLFICTYNTRSMDLGKSQFMNYQGMSIVQWLMIIPLFGNIALIYFIALLLGDNTYSLWIFGITGLVGMIFSRSLLKLVTAQFNRRKYIMSANFRQT
jgi:hypothetical protein